MKSLRLLLALCVVPTYSAVWAQQRDLLGTSVGANATEEGSGLEEKPAASTAGGTKKAIQGKEGSGTNTQGRSGHGGNAKQDAGSTSGSTLTGGGNNKNKNKRGQGGNGGGGGGGTKRGSGGQSGTRSNGTKKKKTGQGKSDQDEAADGGGGDSARIHPGVGGGAARRLRARVVDRRR